MVQVEKNVRNRTAKPFLDNKGKVDKLYHRTERKTLTQKPVFWGAVLKKLQADKQYSKHFLMTVKYRDLNLQGMN